MSLVFQNIDPPPPSPPGECVPLLGGGRTHSPGGEGAGGSIFWKTRDIGLPSYSNNLSTVSPFCASTPHRCHSPPSLRWALCSQCHTPWKTRPARRQNSPRSQCRSPLCQPASWASSSSENSKNIHFVCEGKKIVSWRNGSLEAQRQKLSYRLDIISTY
jgi:hypothetical protein